jgi:hypothetical protein
MLTGGPATTCDAVVERLLAVQAQDERGFRLAIRCRSTGLEAQDVDDGLGTKRLVVTWLNRGTLHLVAAEDYWWLHPLTAPRMAPGIERRLGQEGVDRRQAELGVATVVDSLETEGPLTRHALRLRLDEQGVPTGGQALVHLLAMASVRGLIVRGPVAGGGHAFVAVSRWLGTPPAALGHEEALGRLARRYLAGHGPASARDLAKWAGIALGEARTGIRQVAGDLVDDDGWSGLGSSVPSDGALPTPRLLGAFDPLLHGWASREMTVGSHPEVVTTNGIFRPVALVGGRVVATWGLPGGVVTISLLEKIPPTVGRRLAEDAGDVQRFLGLATTPTVFG